MSKYYKIGKVKVSNFEITDFIKSKKDMNSYLDYLAEEDDPALLLSVINELSRKKGMSKIAKETGLARESLYKSLSENGNPSFYSIYKILRSLGLSLSIKSL